MKSSLVTVILMLTGLLLVPIAVFSETAQGTAGKAPISQPLVREGAFAVKLVESLKMGATQDEAQAENILVTVGVAPRNGWIADYPVTPDIVGELKKSIGDAAEGRQLSIRKDEALKAFDDVLLAYRLPVHPSAPDQVGGNVSSYSPDSTVVNNYYYDEGPPVVTYYAPPLDYAYLYSWVPYPFWWLNFWFPGFFVLQDFDIVVPGHGHHHGGIYGAFITNHFRDSGTGRISRIDPAHRINGGTLASIRGTGWSSTSARRSAQAILNGNRNGGAAKANGIVQSSGSGRISGASLPGRTRNASFGAGGRTFRSHSVMQGTTAPSWGRSRAFNMSSMNRRAFTVPSAGGWTFNSASAVAGRSFSTPSFGGGSFGGPSSLGRSYGSTGSFGGGHRR